MKKEHNAYSSENEGKSNLFYSKWLNYFDCFFTITIKSVDLLLLKTLTSSYRFRKVSSKKATIIKCFQESIEGLQVNK